jgi:uncharacterized membrane protein
MAKSLRKRGERGLAAIQESADSLRDEVASLQEEITGPVALRAATLGFVSGLRSMAPLALLDWTRKHNPSPTNNFEEFLDSPVARVISSTLSAGELVGDKLPITPSRISPAPLIGRLGVGALAGMSIFRRYRQPLVVGALIGAAGACAGTFAGYYTRDTIASSTKAPQWLLGIAEDALTFGLGYLAVKDDDHD